MNSDKLEKSLINLDKAVNRFAEALQEPESSIVMDAAIRRFEFTYELLWKTLKIFLEDIHGIRAVSPRQVFKEAYALSIVEQEDIFLDLPFNLPKPHLGNHHGVYQTIYADADRS